MAGLRAKIKEPLKKFPLTRGMSELIRGKVILLKALFNPELKSRACWERGNQLRQQGQIEKAIAQYSRAIALQPNWAVPYLELANLLTQQGKLQGSIENYNQAIALQPDWAAAYFYRGNALNARCQYSEAIQDYEKAVELGLNWDDLSRNLAIAYFDRGNLFNEQSQYAEAIQDYEKAVNLGLNEENLSQNLATALIDYSKIQTELGQFDEAVENLARAIALQPNSAAAYFYRGNAFNCQRKYAEAIQDYEKAANLGLNEENLSQKLVTALIDYSQIQTELGQLDEAVENLARAIALQPNSAATYFYRGNALNCQRKYPEAIQDYEKAVNLGLNEENLFQNLATALIDYGKIQTELGQFDEAVENLARAIAFQPNSAAAYFYRGDALNCQRKYPEAIQNYEKAIDLGFDWEKVSQSLAATLLALCQINTELNQPHWAEVHIKLGELLQKTNKIDEAIHSYLKASEIYAKLGKNNEYISTYQKIVEYHLRKANTLLEINQTQEAIKVFNDILVDTNKIEAGVQTLVSVHLRAKKATKNVPGIFFSALPKSGSTYIESAICNGLNIQKVRNSAGNFLDVKVEPILLSKLALGGVFARHHVPATVDNLFNLDWVLDKLIVHVREPRQATLSMVHYLSVCQQLDESGKELYAKCVLSYFSLPQQYFLWSFGDRISWSIDNYLPQVLAFVEGWVEAENNPSFRPNILFTKHEDLAINPQKLFSSILDFYEIDASLFSFPEKPQPGQLLYRKGRIDEWREVFTEEQTRKATQMIPERLFDKFGWER